MSYLNKTIIYPCGLFFLLLAGIQQTVFAQADGAMINPIIDRYTAEVSNNIQDKASFYPLHTNNCWGGSGLCLQDMEANLRETTSISDFALTLHKELKKLGDGHARVRRLLRDGHMNDDIIPYNIFWKASNNVQSDGHFIITDSGCNEVNLNDDFITTNDGIELPYLIEIDGEPIADWFAAASEYATHSTRPNQVDVRARVEGAEHLIFVNQLREDRGIAIRNTASITVASSARGDNATTRIVALADSDIDCWIKKRPYKPLLDSGSFFSLIGQDIQPANGGVPYIRIEDMHGYFVEMDDNMANQAMDLLDSLIGFSGQDSVILDLRGNTGGSRDLLVMLYPFLSDEANPRIVNIAAVKRDAGGDPLTGDDEMIITRYLFNADSAYFSQHEENLIMEFASGFRADISSVSDAPQINQRDNFYGDWKYTLLSRDQQHIRAALIDLVGALLNPDSELAASVPDRSLIPTYQATIMGRLNDYTNRLDNSLPGYDRPDKIIILTDEHNFSAVDIFLGAVKGIPGVTLIGTRSAGGSSKSVTYALTPNAGQVADTIEYKLGSILSFNRDGVLYDGVGIAPDIYIEQPPAYYLSRDDDPATGPREDLAHDNVLQEAIRFASDPTDGLLYTQGWRYSDKWDLVYRMNSQSHQIECFSTDEVECRWRRDLLEMETLIGGDMARARALSCGAQHARHWRVTGYDSSGHWCQDLLLSNLVHDPAADFLYQITAENDVACFSTDGVDCEWGNNKSDIKRRLESGDIDHFELLICDGIANECQALAR